MAMNIKKLVELLGGAEATAELCGIPRGTVDVWVHRGAIPKPWVKYLTAVRGKAVEAAHKK